LELVSDADILALADPDDNDGDGISGTPNWINIPPYTNPPSDAVTQNGKYIGRFGKKGAVFNLLQQTVGAYNQDIGITSDFERRDVYSGQDIEPEVSTQTILDVVFYLQTLKVPIQRRSDEPEILQGKDIFIQIGCETCHKQTLVTGNSNVDALSNKTFHPYTDLLVHDMGSELDDGYTEGSALSYEWRTPPLWGLGLAPQSQGGEYFLLHDGRARSISEAIMLHGGEGTGSREKYSQLAMEDKSLLIKFLESL
jgi:CxxC motif-containing protein (DUF1111 family)